VLQIINAKYLYSKAYLYVLGQIDMPWDRLKLVSKREGFIKICCDIPVEWHELIKEHNKDAILQINMSNVMRSAIKECIEEIKNKEQGK